MKHRLPLTRDFFARPSLQVCRELLGQRLVRIESSGQEITGWIVEVEAYVGSQDLACHAKSGLTKRNATMWGPAGHAYVYFTYGMHWMLNFVTETPGFPAAILVRAILPEKGIALMRERRKSDNDAILTDGPGKLCQALMIDGKLNGADICHPDSPLFVECQSMVGEDRVTSGPRVGLNNVPEPWKSKPWRFMIRKQDYFQFTEEIENGIT